MTGEYANWSARGRAPSGDEATLREALARPQPHRRDAALGLVDLAGDGLDERTVRELESLARTADDSETRQFAVEALGVAGAGLSGIESALGDDDEWVRAEAVVALSRAAPDATDRLEALLEDDDSGWVRRNALVAMAKTDSVDEDRYVDCIETDPHPAVREYACQYLRTGDDVDRCVRILAAVLAREGNAYVRANAAESLGEFGTDRAEEALERFGVGDASDDVRRTARKALARARGVDPESLDVDRRPAPGTGSDSVGLPGGDLRAEGSPTTSGRGGYTPGPPPNGRPGTSTDPPGGAPGDPKDSRRR